jgi:hypothetical protein
MLIPPQYFNTVVLIGTKTENSINPIATGFLVGFSAGKTDEKDNPLYKVFLVTNRHVFENKKIVLLRFNLFEGKSKIYELVLEENGKKLWIAHPNEKIDIAAIPINVNLLKEDKIQYAFFPEEVMAFKNTIFNEGISQGDSIFVLGFPMGIVGEEQNYVVARGGIIARLDEEIIEKNHCFLIDCMVYPGNSGSPVILKPELVSIEGTKAVNRAYLLGVVSGYIQYKDVAVSEQTHETRIMFVENSGLATVIPMDFIKETTELFKQ